MKRESEQALRVRPEEVPLTHLDRILFPQDGLTKGDLVDYYGDVAGVMLPHLSGRPLHLQRFPRGIGEEGFVQKEASGGWPAWVRRVTVEKEGGTVTHAVCDNAATLVFLANQAVVTPHVWLSRADRLEYPDRLVWDLDPAGDDFETARAAAGLLRGLLEERGLPAFAMTTGSRGLHMAVPLDRSVDFEAARAFARELAGELTRRAPDRLTLEPRKEDRGGRLYVDILRNAWAQSAVAPYAVRARPGAPVATPLAWEELDDPALTARRWTLRTVRERLERAGDPWAGIGQRAVAVPRERRAA